VKLKHRLGLAAFGALLAGTGICFYNGTFLLLKTPGQWISFPRVGSFLALVALLAPAGWIDRFTHWNRHRNHHHARR